MTGKLRFAGKVLADKTGVTALEYGIIASIIGVTLLGIVTSFGQKVNGLFSAITTSI